VATKTISDEDIPSEVSLVHAKGSARMAEDPTGSNSDGVKKPECVIILSKHSLIFTYHQCFKHT
jgi:hypothetical protein